MALDRSTQWIQLALVRGKHLQGLIIESEVQSDLEAVLTFFEPHQAATEQRLIAFTIAVKILERLARIMPTIAIEVSKRLALEDAQAERHRLLDRCGHHHRHREAEAEGDDPE